jgi:HrpA-like RNA helicase
VQPRKIAAKSLAIRVAQEMGRDFEHLVGYSFGKHDQSENAKTCQILFTSESVFLQKLIKWKTMLENKELDLWRVQKKMPGVLFIDEVHERSFSNDIILGTLKHLHESRLLPEKMSVMLCSATANQQVFRDFFYGCRVIEIEGKTHPIIDRFVGKSGGDVVASVSRQVQEILTQKARGTDLPIFGHILIFLDSVPNIALALEQIEDVIRETADPDDYELL